MFWLGVLSSYCWYKKVIKNALIENRVDEFQDKLEIIKELDEKVSHLTCQLMEEKEIAHRNSLYLSTD